MLATRIRKANPDTLDPEVEISLQEVTRKIDLVHAEISYLYDGNGKTYIPIYIALFDWLTMLMEPIWGWESLQDTKAMPVALSRRLRNIQAELDNLVPAELQIEDKVRIIHEATEAAESLPADLKSLKEARQTVSKISTDAAELFGKIGSHRSNADAALERIRGAEAEAAKLVQQCEEAYRITTTKGLAASFDQRAKKLAISMWVWVVGLLVALTVGSMIGSQRIQLLTTTISSPDPKWGLIWMNVILSLVSVGAPLWFAWLATKQIGQRFRLAEDYGFKASVAKAYEGYRREAARIDISFEARLFSSALSRLEEAPLRLVEMDSHGSPWNELISSPAFQKALGIVPELKDKFIDIAKMSLPSFASSEMGDSKKSAPEQAGASSDDPKELA